MRSVWRRWKCQVWGHWGRWVKIENRRIERLCWRVRWIGEDCPARRVLIGNLFSPRTSRNPNGREFWKTKRKRHLPTVLDRIVREQCARIEQRYYYIIRLMGSSIIYAHSRTTATTKRPNIVTWPSVNDLARGINFVTQSLCSVARVGSGGREMVEMATWTSLNISRFDRSVVCVRVTLPDGDSY